MCTKCTAADCVCFHLLFLILTLKINLRLVLSLNPSADSSSYCPFLFMIVCFRQIDRRLSHRQEDIKVCTVTFTHFLVEHTLGSLPVDEGGKWRFDLRSHTSAPPPRPPLCHIPKYPWWVLLPLTSTVSTWCYCEICLSSKFWGSPVAT